jgi:hypothetical protein
MKIGGFHLILHLLVIATTILTISVGVSKATQSPDFDKDLTTVRIVSKNVGDGMLYVGTKFRLTDDNGQPAQRLTCVEADADTVIISGRLAAEIDPSELETLRRRVQGAPQGSSKLTLLRPDRRDAVMKIGDQTIDFGVVGANAIGPIVLWQMIRKGAMKDNRPEIIIRMFWHEKLVVSDLQLHIDWSMVSKEVGSRAGDSKTISSEELRSIAAYLLDREWVRPIRNITDSAESDLPRPELIDLVAAIIARSVLSPKETSTLNTARTPEPTSYAIRTELKSSQMSTSINLRESFDVDRLFVVHQEIPSCG